MSMGKSENDSSAVEQNMDRFSALEGTKITRSPGGFVVSLSAYDTTTIFVLQHFRHSVLDKGMPAIVKVVMFSLLEEPFMGLLMTIELQTHPG